MGSCHKVSTSILKSATYLLFFMISLILTSGFAYGKIEKKNWQQSPSKKDWSAFNAMSPSEKAKEWAHINSYGLTFEQLSWEWRLGWVRACSTAGSKDCSDIMQLGLFDKALVVRAEAATRLGERFAKTGHPPAIRLLKTAYAIQQNSRSKEPLFVQYRILAALRQIGGEGEAAGKQLSLSNPQTSQYWSSIASR